MNLTGIEWTTFSANPIGYRDASGREVWACIHASEGCRNCYAEALAKRYGRGGPFTAQEMKHLTPFIKEKELRQMLLKKQIGGVPVADSFCFVGDMTDLFGEWIPDELLDRLFAVFALRRDVTWQLLTKRADRLKRYLEGGARVRIGLEALGLVCELVEEGIAFDLGKGLKLAGEGDQTGELVEWPLPNVWIGVSVEDQKTAEQRIPHLLAAPIAVRTVSYEPALGPVDFSPWLRELHRGAIVGDGLECLVDRPCLDQVIVGGESGPNARPLDVAWVRSTVEQCRAAGVAVFVKQLGSHVISNGCTGPDQHWPTPATPAEDTGLGHFRHRLGARKGGDMSEWPEDLRVREMPTRRAA